MTFHILKQISCQMTLFSICQMTLFSIWNLSFFSFLAMCSWEQQVLIFMTWNLSISLFWGVLSYLSNSIRLILRSYIYFISSIPKYFILTMWCLHECVRVCAGACVWCMRYVGTFVCVRDSTPCLLVGRGQTQVSLISALCEAGTLRCS